MKITWFGGSTFRLYVGGKIVVTDAMRAPKGVDAHEVAAAADHKIDLSDGIADFPFLDIDTWRPRKPVRAIDLPEEEIFELYSLTGEAVFIDEPEEGPVIIAPAGQTAWGHFADNAVVVLYGDAENVSEGARNLLIAAKPKLIAIAADRFSDDQFAKLAEVCRDCALQVLETGLAVEA